MCFVWIVRIGFQRLAEARPSVFKILESFRFQSKRGETADRHHPRSPFRLLAVGSGQWGGNEGRSSSRAVLTGTEPLAGECVHYKTIPLPIIIICTTRIAGKSIYNQLIARCI